MILNRFLLSEFMQVEMSVVVDDEKVLAVMIGTFNMLCKFNFIGIYEADAERENMFRLDPEWYRIISEP